MTHTPPPPWWSGIYDDTGEQIPHDTPTGYEPDPARPWWQVPAGILPRLAPEPQHELPAQPAVHVTVTPPPAWQPPRRADLHRARRIHWLLVNGAAGAAGWALGLADAITDAMRGGGGVAMGVGFCLIAAIPAVYLPGLAWVPPALRPLTVWVARIPVASAVLAVLLYAPGGAR